MLRRTITTIAALSVVAVTGYAARLNGDRPSHQTVADVNGEPVELNYWLQRIELSRVNLKMSLEQLQTNQQRSGADTSRQQAAIKRYLDSKELLARQVLDQIVGEIALRQKARHHGITVTTEEVDAMARESLTVFHQGIPVPYIEATEFSVLPGSEDDRPGPGYADTAGAATLAASTNAPTITEATVRTIYEHQLYREKFLAALSGQEDQTHAAARVKVT